MKKDMLDKAKEEAKGKNATPVSSSIKVPTPIKKQQKERKTCAFTTTLTPTNKAKLVKLAEESGMSISNLITFWIENAE